MKEAERALDQLQRAFAGDPWYGAPLMALLEGIDAPMAAAHPIPAAHSIWEIVLHIIAWKNEVRKRLAGKAPADPEEGDWVKTPSPTDTGWRATIDQLEIAQDKLVAGISALTDEDLDRKIGGDRDRPLGSGVSAYVTIHGIIQHDIYHAGQIGLLRKAVRSGER